MRWCHSGCSVDNGVRIKRDDTTGREAIAQYIIRNVYNIKKVKFVEKTSKVIYQGRMKKGKNRKNFEVYSALEFIAAITQHIPNKFSQLTRYFGFYSNRSRGMWAKAEQTPGHRRRKMTEKESISSTFQNTSPRKCHLSPGANVSRKSGNRTHLFARNAWDL